MLEIQDNTALTEAIAAHVNPERIAFAYACKLALAMDDCGEFSGHLIRLTTISQISHERLGNLPEPNPLTTLADQSLYTHDATVSGQHDITCFCSWTVPDFWFSLAG